MSTVENFIHATLFVWSVIGLGLSLLNMFITWSVMHQSHSLCYSKCTNCCTYCISSVLLGCPYISTIKVVQQIYGTASNTLSRRRQVTIDCIPCLLRWSINYYLLRFWRRTNYWTHYIIFYHLSCTSQSPNGLKHLLRLHPCHIQGFKSPTITIWERFS